jgi:glyoxylase-like metal-dependent hydrolase (beta-lactamase superfamily II)
MQEIAPHVFIETAYAGVTLGAINCPHGLILIDSPFRAEDIRSWRSALLNLSGGVDRMLVNLDAHFDRTLGTRAMECTVVGHEKMIQVIRSRPVTFKTQSAESGSEWELYNNLGSIRWAPPEITFSHTLSIYWDGTPIKLEYHAGPSLGAIWAVLPEHKIIFLGDTVVPNQPPFLAFCDLPVWIENLKTLLTPTYREYMLISGRGGMVHMDEVRKQIQYLETAHQLIQELAAKGVEADGSAALVPVLLSAFNPLPELQEFYRQRLTYGLNQYFLRHFGKSAEEEIPQE